jgi:hypothetical protein
MPATELPASDGLTLGELEPFDPCASYADEDDDPDFDEDADFDESLADDEGDYSDDDDDDDFDDEEFGADDPDEY